MSLEPGPDGKLYLGYHNDVIPPLDREERDKLRAELDGMTATLNKALADGWRVVKFDYVVQIERGGYSLLMEMER